jgi:hypothetical protein
MLRPIRELIHNKFVANSVLLAISYELASKLGVANPGFSCSDVQISGNVSLDMLLSMSFKIIKSNGNPSI